MLETEFALAEVQTINLLHEKAHQVQMWRGEAADRERAAEELQYQVGLLILMLRATMFLKGSEGVVLIWQWLS